MTSNVLSRGYNTYSTTLAYDTYDVTAMLRHGPNVLGVELGKGPYDAEDSPGRYMKWTTGPALLS